MAQPMLSRTLRRNNIGASVGQVGRVGRHDELGQRIHCEQPGGHDLVPFTGSFG